MIDIYSCDDVNFIGRKPDDKTHIILAWETKLNNIIMKVILWSTLVATLSIQLIIKCIDISELLAFSVFRMNILFVLLYKNVLRLRSICPEVCLWGGTQSQFIQLALGLCSE